MGTEIERKFLVKGERWRREVTKTLVLCQGYLAVDKLCTVRVRIDGSCAWLTLKGRAAQGVTPEFNYPIPVQDALTILDSLAKRPFIEKKRHLIPQNGLVWEVDEFLGDNSGLIIAEIELAAPDQSFPLPEWVDREVTGEKPYYNSSLVTFPFSQWAQP